MSDQKETFIIRLEWYEAISELCPEDQASIFRSLFLYHSGGEPELHTLPVRLVWKLIEPSLARNADAYDRRRDQARKNGALGGRPSVNQKITKNNQNNQHGYTTETHKPSETLSDSVPVSVLVPVSEGDSVSEDPTSTKKNLEHWLSVENILPAPGHQNADQIFYEQLCMSNGYTMDEMKLIHAAWLGDRIGQIFTLRDARINFTGYTAKWNMNERHRPKNKGTPATAKEPVLYTEGDE